MPALDASPATVPPPAPPWDPDLATGRAGRVVAAAVVGVVLLAAAAAAWIWGPWRGGSSGQASTSTLASSATAPAVSPPDPAPAATPTGSFTTAPARTLGRVRSTSLMRAFAEDDPGDPGDVCFGPGPRPSGTAWMEIDGRRRYSNVIQCGSRGGPDDAFGTLRFRLGDVIPEGAVVVGLGGDLVFDESARSRRGTLGEWSVYVDGELICTTSAAFGDAGRCEDVEQGVETGPGSELTISMSASGFGQGGLWMGVYRPAVRFRV